MRRARLLTLGAIVGWAVGPVGSRALLTAEGAVPSPRPLEVALWAISAGWLLLFLVLAVRGRLSRLRDFAPRGWLVLLAMGFCGWAGYAGSLNIALARLSLPEAVLINYLHPVFTVIFQGAAFGAVVRLISNWEDAPDLAPRPNVLQTASGLLLCLFGVAAVATRGHLGAFGELRSGAGVMAALFAAFAWGVYSNLGRFVAVKPGRRPSDMADVQTFVAMTFGLLMLVAALGPGGQLRAPSGYHVLLYLGALGPFRASAWYVIAAMGLLLYCAGFTLWLVALNLGRQAGEAHRLPPLTYLTPVLSVGLGWLLLHDAVGPGFWQGAALIAAGNLVIALRRAVPKAAEAAAETPRADH